MDDELKDLYYETFPQDRPNRTPRGMLSDIRTGAGHAVQLPVDLYRGAGLHNLTPRTDEIISGVLADAGNAIAGRDLYSPAEADPMNRLMMAIRRSIQGDTPMDIVTETENSTRGGTRAIPHTP